MICGPLVPRHLNAEKTLEIDWERDCQGKVALTTSPQCFIDPTNLKLVDLNMLIVSEAGPERGVITQLRAYLAQAELPEDGRLPPERDLSEALGVSRTELRKALGVLEAEGQIWRHVGKGTFVGSRPIDRIADIAALAKRTNPAEVMRARLIVEPEIATLRSDWRRTKRRSTWLDWRGVREEF